MHEAGDDQGGGELSQEIEDTLGTRVHKAGDCQGGGEYRRLRTLLA